eukprot:2092415-Pyramimonas_sp.AAC.1
MRCEEEEEEEEEPGETDGDHVPAERRDRRPQEPMSPEGKQPAVRNVPSASPRELPGDTGGAPEKCERGSGGFP